MALQSKVKSYHKRRVMNKDVLASSVESCWNSIEMTEKILEIIHKCLKLVLKLIIKGKGTNTLVEKHRGLK